MDQPYQPGTAPAAPTPAQSWPPPWTSTDQPQWTSEIVPQAALAPAVPGGPMPLNVNVNVQQAAPMPIIIAAPTNSGPGFLVRTVWYLFIGCWLGGLAIGVAYTLALTVIGMPLAFAIFDKIPAILTLRGRSKTFAATQANGVVTLNYTNVAQLAFWQRALYFVFIGSWLSLLSVSLGYALCLLIVTLPLGLLLLNRTPAIMTLKKN
jgi:uncharacterized membrane protein YccF (DUF307 family)